MSSHQIAQSLQRKTLPYEKIASILPGVSLSHAFTDLMLMPEIHFQIQWPDCSEETCYSPSLVIKDYFTPNCDYDLNDFLQRSRTALTIASDRVQAKYGRPCGLALAQLQAIERRSVQYSHLSEPKVKVLQFIE